MIDIEIPYGKSTLRAQLPTTAREFQIRDPKNRIDEATFCSQLKKHIREKQLDLTNPVLIVTDKTRRCEYPRYLPLLTDLLADHGMDATRLKIIIGYGTHVRQSEEDSIALYGDCYNRYPFIHHDCDAQELFQELGHTSRGTPIRLRKDILTASCVITMGPICHHYFAGYGGGRKLIFPGCGERQAIYHNHSLFLDETTQTLAPGCQPGVLLNNPIGEDLFEIEDAIHADLAIHGIQDSKGMITEFLMGSGRELFLQACAQHAHICEVKAATFATVVASCGGWPKDINFIQSHKSIHNGSLFVENGGLLLIYAHCGDGIGSDSFLPWIQRKDFPTLFQTLQCGYEGNGGTALAMMAKLLRIRIGMVTSLDERLCQQIGVEKWSHEQVCTHLQNRESLAWLPNSSLLVRKN